MKSIAIARHLTTYYGSARWAEAHEVRQQAGLVNPDGVFLGRWCDD